MGRRPPGFDLKKATLMTVMLLMMMVIVVMVISAMVMMVTVRMHVNRSAS